MLRFQFSLTLIVTTGLLAHRTALAADSVTFPTVPPPSPRIAAPHVEFPAVPPPSPRIVAPPEPVPSTSSPVTSAPRQAVDRAQREEEMKLKKEQQAAKAREDKARRDLEAAKKSGKAPANAYATPVVVETPKAFVGKEGELQEMLILYKAGQISPDEYHKKRAQIIARP